MNAAQAGIRFTLPLLVFCLLFSNVLANPDVADCGLPAQGGIVASVTYTLTADCTQTGLITVANAPPEDQRISLAINGGGYTIRTSNAGVTRGSGILNLNNVTIDGTAGPQTVLVTMDTLNATNVTFTNGNTQVLGGAIALNNVLFSHFSSVGFGLGVNGSALQVNNTVSASLTDVVFRDNYGAAGALMVHSGGTLTSSGCLTLSGNIPYDIYVINGGTWTDNSTGACSGTVGNGGSADFSAPPTAGCGMPTGGILDQSATYSLSGDCVLTGTLKLSEDVNVVIKGSGHTISTNQTTYSLQVAATASLSLERVALDGIRILNFGSFTASHIKGSNAINGLFNNVGEARITNALFENNTVQHGLSSVAIVGNEYGRGSTIFTDVTFRDNSGGRGAIDIWGASVEFHGCILFFNHSPAEVHIWAGSGGTLNDNRDPDCDEPIVDPLLPPPVVEPKTASSPAGAPKTVCNPHCDEPPPRNWHNCDIKLGAIGMVCRPRKQPPAAAVWRIQPNPNGNHPAAIGTFLFGMTQAQVEAVSDRVLACSADGRAALRVGLPDELRQIFASSPKYRDELLIPRRYIVISKGPTSEGKVHHVVLDHTLDGHVFGTVDTFGPPPGADCAAAMAPSVADNAAAVAAVPAYAPAPAAVEPVARAQAAQPDGSIVHIVQPGDTTSAISIAYIVSQRDIIKLNQLSDRGDLIFVGQKLLIRVADDEK